MRGRLLINAAVLLAAWTGTAAKANEPGTVTGQISRRGGNDSVPLTAERSALADATRPANVTAGRSPRVVLILDGTSEQCRQELARLQKPGGEFAAMLAQGWKIGATPESHVQLVDREAVPELLRQLEGGEFPIAACISDGEIVRSFKDGCSTPLDAWTFGWLLKGVNERPRAAIPETIRVATTGHYPLRGNHWSVDGDSNPSKETLVAHLRGPNHAHLLNPGWNIEDWSTEELRSLHDDLHERYGPPATAGPAASRPASTFDQFSGLRKAQGKF